MSRNTVIATIILVAATAALLASRGETPPGDTPPVPTVSDAPSRIEWPSGEPVSPEPALRKVDEGHVFEAEDVTTVVGTWELRSGPGYAQGAALFVGEGTGRNNSDIYRAPKQDFIGKAVYDFEIPKAGVYTVWGLCWSSDQCGNSCWVGFDREWPVYFPEGQKGADNFVWQDGEYQKWRWLKLPPARLSAGKHSMRVEVREDGFLIDQWAILPESTILTGPEKLAANLKPLTARAPWMKVYPRRSVISPGESVTAEVWIHRGSAAALTGSLSVDTPAHVVAQFDADRMRLTGSHHRIDVQLDHDNDFPRGEHEYRFTFTSDDGRTLTSALRMSRPFAWEILAPIAPGDPVPVDHMADPSYSRITWSPQPILWPKTAEGPAGTAKWQAAADLKRWFTPYGFLDFEQGLGMDVENARGYARTTVHAPAAGDYIIETLTDDEGTLWVNGNRVYDNKLRKPATDHFENVPVHLKRGANAIGLSVLQGGRYWQMRLRFRKPDGSLSGVH